VRWRSTEQATLERRLTTLAPEIVAAILDDALPSDITLFELAVDPAALWEEQWGRVRSAPAGLGQRPAAVDDIR
jgi:hypothetical protein